MTLEDLKQKYFSSSLTEAETKAFEQLLASNPEFKAQFELEKDVKSALIAVEKENLKAQFKRFESQNIQTASKIRKTNKFLKYAVAATIIIGLSVLSIKYLAPSTTSTDALYAQYYEPYRNIVAPIERNNANKTFEEQVFENYELGNHEEALSGFDTLFNAHETPYVLFYKGISLLQLERYQEAITTFNDYEKIDERFHDHSTWYRALAYLKTGDTTGAKSLLTEIGATQQYKSKDAKQLLTMLP
jgi:tetratricopeptide (TPR) repeat protein